MYTFSLTRYLNNGHDSNEEIINKLKHKRHGYKIYYGTYFKLFTRNDLIDKLKIGIIDDFIIDVQNQIILPIRSSIIYLFI